MLDAASLRLTLDVGHLHCQGEGPIDQLIRRWAPRLANVHIEDMRAGVHEHLMFGEGEIDFPPILRTLTEIGYTGGALCGAQPPQPHGPGGGETGTGISVADDLSSRKVDHQ